MSNCEAAMSDQPGPPVALTAGGLADQLRALPAGALAMFDDGFEYTPVLGVTAEDQTFVIERDGEELDVTLSCAVIAGGRSGVPLDEWVAEHAEEEWAERPAEERPPTIGNLIDELRKQDPEFVVTLDMEEPLMDLEELVEFLMRPRTIFPTRAAEDGPK